MKYESADTQEGMLKAKAFAAGGVICTFMMAAALVVIGAFIVGGIGWAFLAAGGLMLVVTGFLFVAHYHLNR